MTNASVAGAKNTPISLWRDVGVDSKSAVNARIDSSESAEVVVNASGIELPAVGDVIDGKFRVDACIGAGGMAVVHRGEHLQLKTQVAIKLLRPNLVADGGAVSRFLQEARLAASIENEHSTRIHDVGTTAGGVPFIVMEHLRGTALDARLEREGALGVPEAVSIVLQVLGVLAEAHAKGLVHRDLKPANLLLQDRQDGAVWVKVMDFGISKSIEPAAGATSNLRITAPRSLLGSPQYMSPEQLRDSSSVDRRSDIWSVAVVLYELLTGGRVPFDAPTLPELCALILDKDPEPLRRFRGDVPPGLEDVVRSSLAKDPADRPQTVGELALLLAPYAPETARGSVGRIQATCLKASREHASTRSPLIVEDPRDRSTRPLLSVPAGLLLVLVVGAIAWVAAPWLTAKPETPASDLPSTSRAHESAAPPATSAPLTTTPSPSAATAPRPSASSSSLPSSATSGSPFASATAVMGKPSPPPQRIRRPSEIKLVE